MTIIECEWYEDLNYDKLCTCKHELSVHAFVRSSSYVSVSQCTECRCKEFTPMPVEEEE